MISYYLIFPLRSIISPFLQGILYIVKHISFKERVVSFLMIIYVMYSIWMRKILCRMYILYISMEDLPSMNDTCFLMYSNYTPITGKCQYEFYNFFSPHSQRKTGLSYAPKRLLLPKDGIRYLIYIYIYIYILLYTSILVVSFPAYLRDMYCMYIHFTAIIHL